MKNNPVYFDLFQDNPYLARWKEIGHVKCVGMIVMITWIPLVILSAFHRSESFLTDISIYIKFLVALPLILSSPEMIKAKFEGITNHFLNSDLVKDSEVQKFKSYMYTTKSLRESPMAKTIIWILAYVGVILLMRETTKDFAGSWRTVGEDGILSLSLAGRWFTFVSQPIFSFVMMYFMYQAILWWRFLFLVSKLDLQVRASHGDDTGGLFFLGGSIGAFNFPAMAFSTSIAAGAVNLVLYKGLAVNDLKFTLILLVAFCLLLFVAPLLFFLKPLMRAKRQAIYNYGRLGNYQLEAFENKWLSSSNKGLNPALLESTDFSTVTDTISIVNKAYTMKIMPFSPKNVATLVLFILLPFLPVFAMTMPWKDIFQQLFKLVM